MRNDRHPFGVAANPEPSKSAVIRVAHIARCGNRSTKNPEPSKTAASMAAKHFATLH
ncbi:MAG: hypothetical protein QUS14_13415 [Pyrinomonadaceae bacterium]|nr:hypothetical protein [Pyrinomonadaceae bacterium]